MDSLGSVFMKGYDDNPVLGKGIWGRKAAAAAGPGRLMMMVVMVNTDARVWTGKRKGCSVGRNHKV